MCVTKSVVHERKFSNKTNQNIPHSQIVKQNWTPFKYKLSQKIYNKINLKMQINFVA